MIQYRTTLMNTGEPEKVRYRADLGGPETRKAPEGLSENHVGSQTAPVRP